eukprot:jgi/Ulvmu1/10832/UM007_0006.1
MSAPKFADPSLTDINSDAANNLKLKASVQLSRDSSGDKPSLECHVEGNLIGRVGDEDYDQVLAVLTRGHTAAAPKWPVVASVRTIKRDPELKEVTFVQVRVTAPESSAKNQQKPLDPLLVSPELEDLVKDGRMVSIEQYQSLAQDTEIQAMLQQPDMQKALVSVDSAPAREAALSAALENPQFSALCEQILDHVSPQA